MMRSLHLPNNSLGRFETCPYILGHKDFSMEFNKTEFVQSCEVVPGIDPADGAGTGAHS